MDKCRLTEVLFTVGNPNTPFTRYSRLSKRFDNRVERTATVCSTGCQTGLYNRFDNGLYTRYSRLSNGFDNRLNVCIYDTTGSQTGLTTGLTTGWIVYTNINYNSQDRASIPASCGNYEVFITP